MAPRINAGASVRGVLAYQDDTDPNLFYYFPSAPQLSLDENVEAFRVTYWGIGPPYYSQDPDTGVVTSMVGAMVSGQVIWDCTDEQKAAITAEIRRVYGLASPALIPVTLTDSAVVPVFAEETLGIALDGEASFPDEVQVGSSIAYNVSNGSGRFAQLFANTAAAGNDTGVANPDFALQVYGDIEFVADPWTVEITADLSQVWEFVRKKFTAEVGMKWFNLSTSEVEKTMEELQQESIITITYTEGSLDSRDPGVQLFEQAENIFDALNAQINAGEGLFKLEPVPDPPDPPAGGGSVLPWKVSVSGAYQSSYFKQEIRYETTLSYQGRSIRRFPSSVVLAVTCGEGTYQYFTDLNSTVPCITQEKMDELQERLAEEMAAQNDVVTQAAGDLDSGEIDDDTYSQIVAYLENTSVTESAVPGDDPAAEDRPGPSGRHLRFGLDYPAILAEVRRSQQAGDPPMPRRATARWFSSTRSGKERSTC